MPMVAFGDRAEVWAALVLFIYKHNTLQSGTWNPSRGWFQVPVGLQCVALLPEPREHGWSVLVLCEVTGPCLHLPLSGSQHRRIWEWEDPRAGQPWHYPCVGCSLVPLSGCLGMLKAGWGQQRGAGKEQQGSIPHTCLPRSREQSPCKSGWD